MTKKKLLLAVAPALGLALLVLPVHADSSFNNKYSDTMVTRDCGDSDTVVYDGPLKMWPPNHKLQSTSVTATDGGDDNGDGTTLSLTDAITDFAGGDGGATHDPDVMYPNGPSASGNGSATVDVQLRSERSGRGEGRTYTINWVATFDDGEKTCTSADEGQSPFTVTVPHDMRGGRDW